MKILKKLTAIAISVAVIFSICTCFYTANAVDNLIGDANSDGSINSFDALMIVRYMIGSETLTSAQKKAADVDGNGTVNATDAIYILRYTAGDGTALPAAPEQERIKVFGSFWYDPATGLVTNDSGSGLLGFSYDAHEGVFYASNNAWQRNFGYTHLYDVAAPLAICWYDTTRIFFNYDEKEYMVQLWKGQYGYVLVGCEIGLYYRDENDNTLIDNNGNKFYKCASDDMLIKMSLSLYRNDNLLFTRSERYSWWLTGFIPGALDGWGFSPEATDDLSIYAKITFTDTEMMDAFIGGLEKTTEVMHNVTKKVRTISYKNGKNYSVNRSTSSVTFSWK